MTKTLKGASQNKERTECNEEENSCSAVHNSVIDDLHVIGTGNPCYHRSRYYKTYQKNFMIHLAEEFMKEGVPNKTHHNSMYVITPEFDNRGQMVVRKNIKDMIRGRHVLVVLASAMSGRTITKAIGTILAYGGKVSGLSVIFGNVEEVDGYPVYSVFSQNDLPNFKLSDPDNCPDCKAGKKLDAVVNSYGYEMF